MTTSFYARAISFKEIAQTLNEIAKTFNEIAQTFIVFARKKAFPPKNITLYCKLIRLVIKFCTTTSLQKPASSPNSSNLEKATKQKPNLAASISQKLLAIICPELQKTNLSDYRKKIIQNRHRPHK